METFRDPFGSEAGGEPVDEEKDPYGIEDSGSPPTRDTGDGLPGSL